MAGNPSLSDAPFF